MRLTLADSILLFALVAVAPAYSYYAGVRIARGAMRNRIFAYGRTMLSWWLISLTTLFLWWRLERPFTSLGFVVPLGPRLLLGVILCLLLLTYINGQYRVLRRLPPEKLARIRETLGRTAVVLPHTLAEYRWFLAVSLTAGFCEELLFRGYFFAVTSQWLTIAGAALAGAVIFGLGHAYQGKRGMLKTTTAGLAFGLVYLATGSLLWPVILHVLVDIQGGTIGYRLLRKPLSP